jgi:nicotinate-nucleotide pyrophosphorylase (carboxylating)
MRNGKEIEKLIDRALREDIGPGDITSQAVVDRDLKGTATILAKEKGILAGLKIARKIFKKVDPSLKFNPFKRDGDRIKPQDKIVSITGNIRSILKAERTALNFLQQLSGVATYTSTFVNKVKGSSVKILDTRKTVPGLRALQKYAVKLGGGQNHRMGLYDMILIKENHIKAAGGVTEVIKKAMSFSKKKSKTGKLKIEVETKTFKEVEKAAQMGVDVIMLDNISLPQIRKAVWIIRSIDENIKIEVSGNIDLNLVRQIAKTGIDFISVGALTHSAKALDFSLKVVALK